MPLKGKDPHYKATVVAGDMAKAVECLPSKNKILIEIPILQKEKKATVVFSLSKSRENYSLPH
jgi:hypothetical protein